MAYDFRETARKDEDGLNCAANRRVAVTGNGRLLFLCHSPAFIRALMTSLGALLTMVHFVLGTFITARLTNLSAQGAEFRGIR